MKKRIGVGDLSISQKKLMKLINPKKIKILKILEKDQKINQTEIQKKLKLSSRQTRRYIDSLNQQGIVKRKPVKKKRGSPVFVSLKK